MIELAGIESNLLNDERMKVNIDVIIDGVAYKWFVLLLSETDFNAYLSANEQAIKTKVRAKIYEWENGDRSIPITEYVQPEYPDYWVHRKLEYPSMGQQLDALWKGGQDAAAMKQAVQDVKDKYPKP
jgi:hypothetical protein